MNHTTLRRLFVLMLWAFALVIISTQVNSFILNVAAYEPPAGLIPLSAPPVAQNDSYGVNQNTALSVAAPGVLSNDTDLDSPVLTATLVSNPSHGVVSFNANGSFSYTPNQNFSGTDNFSYVANDGSANSNVATVMIDVRSIAFRADAKEITQGECVLFSWVVKGDVSIVEFDRWDDGKEPILVKEADDRQECPEKDSRYQLIVRWLDGTSDKEQKIDIKVEEAEASTGGGSSSSGGSSSGSGSTTGTGAAPAPATGAFVMVTPILITNVLGPAPATPVPVASETTVAVPEGVLGGIKMLPETGSLPPALASQVNVIQPNHNLTTTELQSDLRLTPIRAIGILLGSITVSWLLLKKSSLKPVDCACLIDCEHS